MKVKTYTARESISDLLALPPLRLVPKIEQRVWGGRRICEFFGRNMGPDQFGESWEIHGTLRIAKGQFKGRTLDSLVQEYGRRLLGKRARTTDSFPLLTKWLDCRDWLSVQVHPDDALARELTKRPDALGKNEAWYIAHREPESSIIHGFKRSFSLDAAGGPIDSALISSIANYKFPSKGDIVFAGAGTPHALGPGLLIYEVQASSDLTYRLFDWGRGREIHAAEFARCLAESSPALHSSIAEGVACSDFEVLILNRSTSLIVGEDSFVVLAAVEGTCAVRGGFGEFNLAYGDSVLLPAGAGFIDLELEGAGRVLSVKLGEPAG